MTPVTPLDEGIDRLYRLPLDEFVSARNDLARQFRGEEGKAVRALAKPNLAAWALNQLYWSARPAFDQLVTAAARLREAQATGLQGKGADLRGAGTAHRDALLAAVREAAGILERAGHDAGPDTLRSLTAALEALPWEERAGRLVRPPEPAGFAVFAGMALPKAPAPDTPAPDAPARVEGAPAPRGETARPAGRARRRETTGQTKDRERQNRGEQRVRDDRERERQEREARRRESVETARRAAHAAAEQARVAGEQLARAREDERAARERLEEARRALKEADVAFKEAERAAAAAQAALRKA